MKSRSHDTAGAATVVAGEEASTAPSPSTASTASTETAATAGAASIADFASAGDRPAGVALPVSDRKPRFDAGGSGGGDSIRPPQTAGPETRNAAQFGDRPKRKICVVVTARASYARIKTALEAIRAHPQLELQLVVAASALLERYGAVVEVMQRDGFEPDAVVYMVVEGENLVTTAKSTGLGVVELATIFDNLKPDFVITVADRYETIATAIAASYLNIPLAHVQGGEITGSIDEKVRHAVTKLANVHFVANETAAKRVLAMGEDPATVHVTGCPSVDLARRVLAEPRGGFAPFEKYFGVGEPFDINDDFLVVMQHPVTTEFGQGLTQIRETLEAVRELRLPTVWFWPNVDAGSDDISKGIRHFRETHRLSKLYFLKNMDPEDFLRLLCRCRCLVGNSSVGIRESAYLGVPVVNIGARQNGRDRGDNVIDVGYRRGEIIAAVHTHFERVARGQHYPSEAIYGDGRAGERIADLLATVQPQIAKVLTY